MRIHGLAIASFLVACGPKAAPAPEAAAPPAPAAEPAPASESGVPAELAATIERGLALFEELTVAAESAGGDCGAMGAAMQTVVDGPNGQAIREADAYPDFERHAAAIDAEYGPRLDALASRFFATAQPCETDPGVNAALEQVGLGGPPAE